MSLSYHRLVHWRVVLQSSVSSLTPVAVAIALGACGSDQIATDSVAPIRARALAAGPTAAVILSSAVSGKSNRSFEDEILRLEAAVPEVGGVYVDGDALVVLLTDMRAVGALRQALAVHIPTWRVTADRKARALASTVRVLPAKYAFSQLVAWQQMLTESADVESLDADEMTNRVAATVTTVEAARRVASLGMQLRIPAGALTVRIAAPAHDVSDIRDYFRPTGGGIQLTYEAEPLWCTLGWNVTTSTNAKGFVTAGHCLGSSKGTGALGGRFHQANVEWNGLVGTVAINPPWNVVDPYCDPAAPLCTAADAMFVQSTGSENDVRKVVKTNSVGQNNGSGSITYNGWWLNVGTVGYVAMANDPVDKVGRLTGWTRGTVSQTCVNNTVSGATKLCETVVVNARVGAGDSGSPTFLLSGGNFVVPLGIVTSAGGTVIQYDPTQGQSPGAWYCTGGCFFRYADFAHIQTHLGVTLSSQSY